MRAPSTPSAARPLLGRNPCAWIALCLALATLGGACADGAPRPSDADAGFSDTRTTDTGGLDTGTPAANPDGDTTTVACKSNDACEGICREGRCVAPSCSDGVKNGDETDVDCGGPSCEACAAGDQCESASDCESSVCTQKTCASPSCSDKVKNGSESDVDCGGKSCPGCQTGEDCSDPADCANKVCEQGSCQAPTCDDEVENGNEAAVDCGGDDSPCPPCGNKESCQTDDDCKSDNCDQGICQAKVCSNGMKDGQETDVDCGGPNCAGCMTGEMCNQNSDCKMGSCSSQGVCKAPSCSDGVQNGNETDADCGGPSCKGCKAGKSCGSDSDCRSGVCSSQGTCQSPSCSDGVQNGKETDVDCGGSSCNACSPGDSCNADSDCTSGVCSSQGTCQSPSCSDGVQNGKETDVDCGGSSCNGCSSGQSCSKDSDCKTGLVCDPSTATCTAVNSKSIEFNGSSSYGAIPHSPELSLTDELTLEAWVKPSSGSGHRDIIGQHNGSYRWRLTSGGSGGGRVWLFLRYSDDTYNTYESSSSVPLNTWTHIAVTFDSSTGSIKFYINGSLDKMTTGKSMSVRARSWEMDLGYYSATNSEYFAGKMDEIRLWETVRSQSQISNDMNRSVSSSSSDLVAYWNAESQPSSKLLDQTSNSNDISTTNVTYPTDTPF